MKCSRCGTALRMEKVSRPVYGTKTQLGIGDRLRYQADANDVSAIDESEITAEIMHEAADLFDAMQLKFQAAASIKDLSNLHEWMKEKVFNRSEQIQTGTEETEEPSDCPRCQGSY